VWRKKTPDMKTKFAAFLIIALFVSSTSFAHVGNSKYIDKVTLQTGASTFSTSTDTVNYQSKSYLFFQYTKDNETCDVKIYPSGKHNIKDISVVESADFKLLDEVVNYNNVYYTFKVQFQHLASSSFLRFRLNIALDSTSVMQDIPLLPITNTTVEMSTKGDELTVGEEKVFELISNHPENIKPVPDWQNTPDAGYRITANNGQLFIHLLANAVGNKSIPINLQTYRPYFSGSGLSCDLPILNPVFNVKKAGLTFLQTDKSDFTLDDKLKNEGVEIQIDNSKNLQLNNTYLVEGKETPGSPLIAEIFTRERLSNNKVLCILRAFNYHRKSDGYLYIKDDDNARFISNFNILPKVSIEHIKIMRNGKDWKEDTTIYPGETFNLRLEGQSLDKSNFHFNELLNLNSDSLTRNDNSVEYKLKVPLDISKKNIEIYNYNENTGKTLTIKEYENPHPFDYIKINYGNGSKTLSDIHGPELYDKTIKDVVISFQPNKIDSISKLYGKQYLTLEIKVLGKKDEVIDEATVDDITVCPGDKSPRYPFYDKSDCKTQEISLNSKITNTTYSLKDWSKIKLTFKNPSDKYPQGAQEKTVEIIIQKHYDFDIDVSFPTGLLIKKMDTPGLGNFGGVSMAVIGQYSFYKKDKINSLEPFKVGAGFLAVNAFDFSNDKSTRDLGAVVLGTLNPINTDRKLSFSIYLGGGYLLSSKTLFWLIGPGLTVQF
jgi:hypothetical protein